MSNRFGSLLRGYRLGFYWSEDHKYFVRVMAVHGKPYAFVIELAADAEHMPTSHDVTFICWHEGPNGGRDTLRMCPILEDIREGRRKVNGYARILVGEDGLEVVE